MIYLLKSRSDDSEVGRADPYEATFGANITFVPILKFISLNAPILLDMLRTQLIYDAFIVTSQRAVDSLKTALSKLNNIDSVLSTPVYTVGPTTASRLELLGFKDVRGAESGNGKMLAKSILCETSEKRKFLFLAGETHRVELPNQLIDAGNTVTTQVVYRSENNNYESLLEDVKAGDWVVFFSPSHSVAAIDVVKKTPSVRVAAIGPTTKAFLEDSGITVAAMAPKPSAEALEFAIKENS